MEQKPYERWVTICWDVCPTRKKLLPYIRLTPEFMLLEEAGHPWGVTIHTFFETKEEAEEYATFYAGFMDKMISHYEHHKRWQQEYNEATISL